MREATLDVHTHPIHLSRLSCLMTQQHYSAKSLSAFETTDPTTCNLLWNQVLMQEAVFAWRCHKLFVSNRIQSHLLGAKFCGQKVMQRWGKLDQLHFSLLAAGLGVKTVIWNKWMRLILGTIKIFAHIINKQQKCLFVGALKEVKRNSLETSKEHISTSKGFWNFHNIYLCKNIQTFF